MQATCSNLVRNVLSHRDKLIISDTDRLHPGSTACGAVVPVLQCRPRDILTYYYLWLKCKTIGGGTLWTPDNGRVPFPGIITI